MTQKLSDAFGREPRDKDFDDAAAVLRLWEGHEGSTASAINIVKKAVSALTRQPIDQVEITEKRINRFVPKVIPLK